ncbi:hypothetical protein DYB26_014138 [Aphanomyces astaci]|uniref:HTH psq-type domain-containing protein n=1 Tax=Aphanomyces astaci TaxID=112090 RepID=A0A418FZU2_APHAT|nr:hypothetical protein DYB26_014138 [Aphanomyces astaci]
MGLSRQYSKEKLLEASADVISGTLISKQASVKYAIPQRTIQNKTVTVAGRLLTVKLLRDIDASKEAKAAATAAKKALKAASKSRKGKGKAKLVARIVQEITV